MCTDLRTVSPIISENLSVMMESCILTPSENWYPGVPITIPATPPIIVTPQYLVFSSKGSLNTASSSKVKM